MPQLRRVLYETSHGGIAWHCLAPCAQVEVVCSDGRMLTGLGYAECLDITLKPWQLPIREVWWGRFLSATDAVAWIEWRGPVPRRWVFHNGVEVADASINAMSVDLTDSRGMVLLEDREVIRTGALTATVLRPFARVRRLLPRGVKNVEETKWCSRGRLDGRTHASAGWAIHEVVRWV